MKKSINQTSGISDVVQQRRTRLATQAVPEINAPGDHTIKAVNGWTLREPVSRKTYSVIKIQTASGLIGFGECGALLPDEFAEAKKIITGIPATSFETIAPFLAKYPTARAGINIAMLDIVGKIANVPVFQLLGGPTRYRARVITPITGETDTELVASMKRAIAAGFKAFMVPVYPPVNTNQGMSYVVATRKRLDTLREAGGQDMDFVLDGQNKMNPGDAQMVSDAIENFHVLWFNEPCPPLNLGTLKKLSAENVTPIGIGRHLIQPGDFQNLLREDSVDIIRPDLGLNGISQIRRMAAIAETYYIAVGATHYGGPIGTAAGLQLAASIPNFFIQQIPFPDAVEDRNMRIELTLSPVEIIKDGFAELPLGPGLGITVNEKSLEKYKEVTL